MAHEERGQKVTLQKLCLGCCQDKRHVGFPRANGDLAKLIRLSYVALSKVILLLAYTKNFIAKNHFV